MPILACAAALAIVFSGPLPAQIDRGGVTGTVRDSTGAVVPAAELTLTNEATSVAQKVKSSSSGSYVFDAVPSGSYVLKVEAAGFKAYLSAGIQVHIQTRVTADVSLQVGALTEVMTVTAATPLLQAQDASLGQNIDGEVVNDLPLNGRNWISLASLAPGSYLTGGANTTTIFANGAEPGQVDYRVSGVNNNMEVFGGYSVAPVPDAIEEFKLQTGNNSAEFGHSIGAVINASVKSGTNRVRGNVWEYLRNEALNANDFFSNMNGVKRAAYRQNQFGGTIGGPVYIPGRYNGKGKTFFFFDFQRTERTQPNTFTDTVPTDLMRNSNYTNLQDLISGNSGTATDALGRKFPLGAVFDPATTRSLAPGAVDPVSGLVNTRSGAISVRDPFYNGSLNGLTDFTRLAGQLNVIPASRFDPNAIKLLQLLPAPTKAGLQNNFFTSVPQTTTANQYDIRIDENISSKDLLFGVLSRQTQNQASAQPFSADLGSALQTNFATTQPVYVLALSETHLFSPTLVNEARVGLNHNYNTRAIPNLNTLNMPQRYGIQGIPQIPGNGGLPTFNVNGFSAFGSRRFSPTIQTTEAQDYTDNVTLIRGAHQLKMGVQVNRIVGNIIQPAYSRGNFSWTGQYSDIPNQNTNLVGIADFLLVPAVSSISPSTGVTTFDNLGGLSGYNGSNYGPSNYSAKYIAGYAQEGWKIAPNLTLNLGLRWEYFGPYVEASGRQANMSMTNGNGPSGTYYIPKDGCTVPRSAAFEALLSGYHIEIKCVDGHSVNRAQMANFGPRLGIAYRLFSGLVLRAGYGISYGAFDSVGYGGTMGTNYPFQYTINSPPTTSLGLPNGQRATMETIFSAVDIQDPTQITGQGIGLVGKQYDYKTPYTQSMNFTVQYQFSRRDALSAGYVATAGRHLDTLGTFNALSVMLPPGVGANNYKPFPNLGSAQYLSTNALSNYRSLQTVYEHRFRGGVVLHANYTWGKCMSDVTGKTGMGPGYRAQWLPGFGLRGDYTLCGADATHVAHVAGGYALPFGRGGALLRNANGFVNALAGGWRANYIYIYQGGQPFSVGCPVATTSGFGCTAFFVPGQDPYAGPHNRTQWLNPAAFSQPPAATQIGQTDYAPLGGKPNQLRGPALKNLDASLFKRFAVREKQQLEFRAEAFNISNSVDFGNPGQLNFKNLKNFSNITGTRNNQRLVQLALKLFF